MVAAVVVMVAVVVVPHSITCPSFLLLSECVCVPLFSWSCYGTILWPSKVRVCVGGWGYVYISLTDTSLSLSLTLSLTHTHT